jgi:hypothetical protein
LKKERLEATLIRERLSKAGENHIKPSDPGRTTLARPALLIMPQSGRQAESLFALGRSASRTILVAANPPRGKSSSNKPFLSQLPD